MSAHFLHHCPKYLTGRSTSLNIIINIDENILRKNDFQLTETLFYGYNHSNESFNITNTLILNATIDFLIATKRFDVPLFRMNLYWQHLVKFMLFLFVCIFFIIIPRYMK